MFTWRAGFDRAVSEGAEVKGIVYSGHLAGPDGLDVWLMPPAGTPPTVIDRCREALYAEHDIVTFAVRPVPVAWYEETAFTAGPERGWLDAVKWVVASQQCQRVDIETGQLVPDDKRGGMWLDLFSAGAMLQVYEGLSAANRERLAAMPLPVAHDAVFRVLDAASRK